MASLKYLSAEPNLQTVSLASDYTAGDGHMHLTAGHGARLPSTGDFWLRTPVTGTLANIFKCTARSTDQITVSAVTGYGADQNLAAGTELCWSLTGEALDQLKSDLCPTRAEMWHDTSIVTVGNGLLTYVGTSTHSYVVLAYQYVSANGDTFTQSFVLASGTYTFRVVGRIGPDHGRIDWYIDDVKVISLQDWYNATYVYDTIKSVGSIAVSGNGRHVLKGTINGKHASATAYGMLLTKMSLIPASDVGSV